jgi:hypothetical protein
MYIGSAAMPVLFINGTNDFAYPLDSYAKTYNLVKDRNLRITVNMPHGHKEGWAPAEIGLFIDEHLIDGKPLPKVQQPRTADGQVVAKVRTQTSLVSAELAYTTETGPINKRNWQKLPAEIEGKRIIAKAPPQEATIWFFTVTDDRGGVTSSEVIFPAKP